MALRISGAVAGENWRTIVAGGSKNLGHRSWAGAVILVTISVSTGDSPREPPPGPAEGANVHVQTDESSSCNMSSSIDHP